VSIHSVGILGLGSIGRRHARVLRSLQNDVQIYAHRTSRGALHEAVEGIIELDRDAFFSSTFDLVVIANPSSLHLRTLEDVLRAGAARAILVEKPFCLPDEAVTTERLIAESAPIRILPGNTLRFHPAVSLLKAAIQDSGLGSVLECHAHFGTYMPGWHPYEDYRSTYAARRDLGGGVLLTSIHEIDLVHHLFGKGSVAGARVGRLLLDEIDVEDSAHLLLTLERCRIANVSLNFFERPADRFLKVIFERGVWSWRFGQPAVVACWNGDRLDETRYDVDASVDVMYLNMWDRVLRDDLADFEMDSVFSSLRTAETARAMSEASGWN
jgi:predicted dehydrogenase